MIQDGIATVHDIIRDTCRAIWITLKNEVMPDPTLERWQEIEKGFRVRWNFPNCLGAWMGSMLTSLLLQIVQVLFTTTRDTFQQF